MAEKYIRKRRRRSAGSEARAIAGAITSMRIDDLIFHLASGIAEGQGKLDDVCMEIAAFMGEPRIAFGKNPITNEPDMVSLLELGFSPNFYQFVDSILEVKVGITSTYEERHERSISDTDAYLTDFGFDGQKVKNLNVKFNPSGDIDISTPCHVSISGENGDLNISADSMRVFGRKGVTVAEDYANPDMGIATTGRLTIVSTEGNAEFFKGLTLEAESICVQALKTAKIGMQSEVTANSVKIISKGNLPSSNANIKQGTTVTADEIELKASRSASIGETVVVTSSNVAVNSTGDKVKSVASIKQAAKVTTTNSLSLSSGNKANVGKNTEVTVTGNFEMSAETLNKCSVSSTAVITLGSKSGNCASLLPEPL